jgi:urease accessory protein
MRRNSARRFAPAGRGRRRAARMSGEVRNQAERVAQPASAKLAAADLYRLMTWLSPAYPVGAFAYSSGIEWAVEAGDITDAAGLQPWLGAMLEVGAGLSDGILFAQTHRAIAHGDAACAVAIAELAAALSPTRERYLETTTLGRTFAEVTRAAWSCPALDELQAIWVGPLTYPVAVGAVCGGHGIPLAASLHAFLTALLSNWISAGVRLIPLGHTDGQRLLRALEPSVAATTQRALAATLEDCASATFRADIASARHESQYTRLFRS